MSLRWKSLIILGGTVAVLVLALVVVSQTILKGSFDDLEQRETSTEVERALAGVEGRVSALETVVGDWAPWDDTYEFLLDSNEEYIDSNLDASTLENLGVDFMLFVRNSGEIVHAASYDPWSGEPSEPPEAVLKELVSGGVLLDHPDEESSVAGLIDTADGPLMVASQPILTSDLEGPIEGSLIVGRAFNEEELAGLEEATRLAIAIAPLGTDDLPTDFAAAWARLASGPDSFVAPRSDDEVSGYSMLPDIHGEPSFLLRVTTDRGVYRRGAASTLYVTVAVLALGAAFLLAFWVLLHRLILTRLFRLSSRVHSVGQEGDSSARVTEEGNDEIASLANGINGMLHVMEKSEAGLREAGRELETRVQERTAELAEVNTALNAEIEERRAAEWALVASEERLRSLVENMAYAVLTLDTAGTVTFANPEAVRLTGLASSDLVGRHFSSLVDAESLSAIERQLRALDPAVVQGTREIVVRKPDGNKVPVELAISPLLDLRSQLAGVQWVARDVSERKRFEAQLVHTANHDFLTGLMNRRGFEEEVERSLRQVRRLGAQGSILWLDLDDFKAVNDSLGHRAGDSLLIDLAARLAGQLREYDMLARLGGDEFAVLLPQTDADEAQVVARRILSTVRGDSFMIDGHAIRVTASIGIVIFPDHGLAVEELLARADVAMYRAKSLSRDGVCLYEPGADWHTDVGSRLTWAERIEAALADDSFVVYAQPILDLTNKTVSSYELLIRLRDEDGTILPPGMFLHHAERAGLIRDIDRWMVVRAINIIAEQLRHGRQVRLDVNVSAKAFTDPQILPAVREALADTGIPPALLGIEITETAAATDLVRAQTFIESLRTLGCRFSLDDFGAGFSSFYYLKHLAVDTLKIDGSFVKDLPRSAEDQHLVKAIIELARGLDMDSVAEFVEDEETFSMLGEYGATRAQGYHLGIPGPVEEVLAGSWSEALTRGADAGSSDVPPDQAVVER